jgi:hypothetical protein
MNALEVLKDVLIDIRRGSRRELEFTPDEVARHDRLQSDARTMGMDIGSYVEYEVEQTIAEIEAQQQELIDAIR